MSQMHLLLMAYCYYDDLLPAAQEHLITSLLAGGTVHGPGNDDTHTSGFFLETWSRAGMISPLGIKKSIGETENHILMIMATRYLTNQLLYQRDPQLQFDNRRNSLGEVAAEYFATHPVPLVTVSPVPPHKDPTPGSCAFLLLDLLQRILRDDFSEYNAKSYQKETRRALVNLCNYAYDHEIRLAARMVLDYISAHFLVSTNDLRRLVPFRRLNESPKTARDDEAEVGGHRNCDNIEIFASSPSYLITAGGQPAPYAIDPYILGIPAPGSEKQVGVAVTTTFMPTTYRHRAIYAQDLIQFSFFAEYGDVRNYGVAPDFACGPQIKLPAWVNHLQGTPYYVSDGNFIFINQGTPIDSQEAKLLQRPGFTTNEGRPGFYLAIYQENGLGLMEA